MNSYNCPSCDHVQDSVLEWFTEAVVYQRYLGEDVSEEVDKYNRGFDFYACPECGKELPASIARKLS